jgi:hypothetical protein
VLRVQGLDVATIVLVSCLVGCGSREPRTAITPPKPDVVQPPALGLSVTGLDGVDLRAPVTAASLAGRVPGYTATESVEYFENSPDTAVPTICLVRRGGACDLVLFTTDGTITRIRVLDPAVLASNVAGVGRAYLAVRAGLENCEVMDGLERGMNCKVRGASNIEAWFALGDDVKIAGATPTPEILERATVTHLWWWLPGT